MPVQHGKIHVPFAKGINTKVDPNHLQVEELDKCENGVFEEWGGIQKRNGFANLSNSIVGGGTISDPRTLATREDELVLFTKDKLYSWSPAEDAWAERADHLAAKVTEQTVFAKNSDQNLGDRAELSGVEVFAWEDSETTTVHLSAKDQTTGAVLVDDVDQGGSTTRPRLIALTNVILLFVEDGGVIKAKSIDPDDLSTDAAKAFTNIATGSDTFYDVCKRDATAALVANSTAAGSYDLRVVGEAVNAGGDLSRTAIDTSDDVICIACNAAGTEAGVAYIASGVVRATIVSATALTDIRASTILKSTTDAQQITGAFDTDSSPERFHVFWSDAETSAYVSARTELVTDSVFTGWIDNAAGTGAATTLARDLGVGSKAFRYNGDVMVALVFSKPSHFLALGTDQGNQLQNCYLLYRRDGHIAARLVSELAGGYVPKQGHLPEFTNTSGNVFKMCGVKNARAIAGSSERVVATKYKGVGSGRRRRFVKEVKLYLDGGLVDISVEFDAFEARQTVQIGKTMYVAGGQMGQYDGTQLVEVGFHYHPWLMFPSTSGTGGDLEAGKTYTWKSYDYWQNSTGERERSTTATLANFPVLAPNTEVDITMPYLHATGKSDVSREVYRTKKAPTPQSPYYKATSADPTATGENAYITNSKNAASFSWNDTLSDSTWVSSRTPLDEREIDYQNSGELDNIVPPPHTVLAAGRDRLYIAGVGDDPNSVWFSKLRFEGDIAAFNEGFSIQLPKLGGDIKAVVSMNDALVVFKKQRIYLITGEGPDNLNNGLFSEPQLLPVDVGCTDPRTVAIVDQGIVFLSQKGFQLLDQSFQVQFIGAAVEDYQSQTFTAAVRLPDRHQVIFLADSGQSLMYDYLLNQWATWTITADSGVLWNDTLVYLDESTGRVRQQDSSYTDASTGYSRTVRTGWFQLDGIAGYGRLKWISLTGENTADHRINVKVYYNGDDTEVAQEKDHIPSQTADGTAIQSGDPVFMRFRSAVQKVSTVKLEITDETVAGAASNNASFKLSALSFEFAPKKGLHRAGQHRTE